jgi:hypothetical protein
MFVGYLHRLKQRFPLIPAFSISVEAERLSAGDWHEFFKICCCNEGRQLSYCFDTQDQLEQFMHGLLSCDAFDDLTQ